MDANEAEAYRMGAMFGAVFVGILCGLIPVAVARKRDRAGLGWVGFGLCVVSGYFLGLIGALPMAGLMSLVIVVAGPPKRKTRPTGSAPKPRTPTPQSYDL
jgi:hypothetical protein